MSAHLDGLNLVELLDLLEPATEPEPVSMMPQTAGWIWLGLAVVLLLGMTLRKYLRHRRANRYRRAGMAALKTSGNDPAQIAAVIRRTALAGFSRDEVAHLTGDAWLRFLDSTIQGTGFSHGPGRVLSTAAYQRMPPEPGLPALAQHWIAKHKVPEASDEVEST